MKEFLEEQALVMAVGFTIIYIIQTFVEIIYKKPDVLEVPNKHCFKTNVKKFFSFQSFLYFSIGVTWSFAIVGVNFWSTILATVFGLFLIFALSCLKHKACKNSCKIKKFTKDNDNSELIGKQAELIKMTDGKGKCEVYYGCETLAFDCKCKYRNNRKYKVNYPKHTVLKIVDVDGDILLLENEEKIK